MKLNQTRQAAIAITFVLINPAVAGNLPAFMEHPTYRDGILYVPRVDTDEQAGSFLDARFQFDNAADTWKLLDFYTTHPLPGGVLNAGTINPDTVEVITTSSAPVQVFLKARVQFGDGCIRYGQINQRLTGNKFEIVMHRDTLIHPTVVCSDPATDEKIIPLQVYGLPGGTYEYSVNGQHTGTFTLAQDNTL